MRKILAPSIACLCLLLAGCSQEEKVEKQVKVTTPEGTTTHTITDKVDRTGEHKLGDHTSACTCVKDADGKCECNKAGGVCKCTTSNPRP